MTYFGLFWFWYLRRSWILFEFRNSNSYKHVFSLRKYKSGNIADRDVSFFVKWRFWFFLNWFWTIQNRGSPSKWGPRIDEAVVGFICILRILMLKQFRKNAPFLLHSVFCVWIIHHCPSLSLYLMLYFQTMKTGVVWPFFGETFTTI